MFAINPNIIILFLVFIAPSRAAEGAALPSSPGCGCFVAGTGVHTAGGIVPIESLKVGGRVLTFAEEEKNRFESSEGVRVDAATWKQVTLRMDRGRMGTLEAVLLRPPEWFEAHRAEAGAEIFLELPEMGARGWAKVEAVASCPALAEGAGRLITGAFKLTHGKPADLKLQGIDQAIGVTLHHLIWSEGDGMWIPVGRLESGDKVRVLGEVVTVASVESRGETEAVYNIEVDGDHVYRVADAGVLVHNTSCDLILRVGPWDQNKMLIKEARSLGKNTSSGLVLVAHHFPARAAYRLPLSITNKAPSIVIPNVDIHPFTTTWKRAPLTAPLLDQVSIERTNLAAILTPRYDSRYVLRQLDELERQSIAFLIQHGRI